MARSAESGTALELIKAEVHLQFVNRMSVEAESVAAAAKNSSAMAASDAQRAESKSDTFRHEFSCLARVQAVKLEELALKRMQSMPLSTYLVVSAE